MNPSKNPKRGSAFIGTAKVLILAASMAATVGGWAAMSSPASAATTSAASAAGTATTGTQANTTSNSLAATLAQVTSASASVVQYQPVVRTRSSR